MRLRDEGLFTAAEAESLDAWASELATKMQQGLITRADVGRLVLERLHTDLRRRGQA